MKKLSLLILLFLSATNVFAGYTATNTHKCNWWYNRYKSMARISVGIPICYQSSANCSGNYSWSLHPTCSKDCGFQEAWSGPSGQGQNGYISKNICSRGEILNDITEALLPDGGNPNNNTDTLETSSTNIDSTIYDEVNHRIIFKGFSCRIRLSKQNGFLSKVRLALWQPNDDTVNHVQDTTVDNYEIISGIEIEATDAGISLNGAWGKLIAKQATIIDNQSYTEIVISNIDFSIPVPANVDLNDITVLLDGDGAPNTPANYRKAETNTINAVEKKQIAFNCTPNPTTGNFNIHFSNVTESGATEIMIFDINGKKIKEIFNGEIAKDQDLNFSVDLGSFPPQTYTVLVKCNGKQYIEKVIKN